MLFAALSILTILAFLASCGGSNLSQGSPSEGSPPEDEVSGPDTSGGQAELGTPAIGEAGAPVVMIEYGDYQ